MSDPSSDLSKPFQIRGEEYGLNWVASLDEALRIANETPDIWKISFDINGSCVCLVRLRMHHEDDLWVLDQMNISPLSQVEPR